MVIDFVRDFFIPGTYIRIIRSSLSVDSGRTQIPRDFDLVSVCQRKRPGLRFLDMAKTESVAERAH